MHRLLHHSKVLQLQGLVSLASLHVPQSGCNAIDTDQRAVFTPRSSVLLPDALSPAPILPMWLPLQSARIQNFRTIRELQLDLRRDVNVLVGTAAADGSNVLDALAIGLGAYHARLPDTRGRTFSRTDDLRIRAHDTPTQSEASRNPAGSPGVRLVSTDGVQWARGLGSRRQHDEPAVYDKRVATVADVDPEVDGPRPNTRLLNRQIDERVLAYLDTPSPEQRPTMPFAAAYGTQRTWLDVPLRETALLNHFKRFAALDGSLDTSRSFHGVFEWFRLMEDEERRQKQLRRDFDFCLSDLQWVRDAFNNAGLRCRNPRVELRPTRMIVDFQHDDETWQPLDFTHLSEGDRAHFSLVLDIARRMVQLNPSDDLNHPDRGTNTVGTVLIDQIELHLHPDRHYAVLQSLRAAFPNTQFIVTTRSEGVDASLPREYVQRLVWTDDGIVGADTV